MPFFFLIQPIVDKSGKMSVTHDIEFRIILCGNDDEELTAVGCKFSQIDFEFL